MSADPVPAWTPQPPPARWGPGRVVALVLGLLLLVPALGLLAGGGYAERVAVPAGQLLPRPSGVELATAAALPEVVCTVWSNVFMLAGLRRGDTFLVHGGSSGIGTMAIQLAARAGARVLTTAGTQAKLDVCRELGAEVCVNYRDEDFVERVREETDGAGVDVVLDNMGAKYLPRNVDALAVGGRLVEASGHIGKVLLLPED